MKDLYRRGNLQPYESDRNRILDCDGLPEDIEAACVVLLDDKRRSEYDQCYSVLRTVVSARRNLAIPTGEGWKHQYQDFYYVSAKEGMKPKAPASKASNKLASLKWVGVVLAGCAVLFIGSQIDFGVTEVEGELQEYSGKVLVKEVYSSSASVREAADSQAKILAMLARYDKADVLVDKSTAEWDFVKLENIHGLAKVQGFVFNEHLSIGNNETEELSRCAELGVQRLANGETISTLQQGPHKLTVVNQLSQDVIVNLKNRAGVKIVSLYMWGHQTVMFENIPDGSFQISYASGKSYSTTCGRFLEQMQAMVDGRYIEFEGSEWTEEARSVTELTYILGNSANKLFPVPARLF